MSKAVNFDDEYSVVFAFAHTHALLFSCFVGLTCIVYCVILLLVYSYMYTHTKQI